MKSKIGIVKMKRTLGLLLASACFASEFGQTMAQETLVVQYGVANRTVEGFRETRTLRVEKDSEHLKIDFPFGDDDLLNWVRIPEGLTKVHTLEIDTVGVVLDQSTFELSISLPKDIGKDAEWPPRFRINLSLLYILEVHEEMGPFTVITGSAPLPLRIPSAKDLIRNQEPNDDGVFRISPHYGVKTIEVHGVSPRIWLNRREGGVEIAWDRGQLQSAPSIDGPWTDITFDDTRRLFLRSSSPTEFFRVKPQE